jgi:hypothetical protein
MKKADAIVEAVGTDVLKDALDSVTRHATEERGEVVDSRAPRPSADEGANSVDIDFLVALQSGSLTVDHVTALAEDDTAIIKEHQEMATRFVQMNAKLVDGSMSDKEVMNAIKTSTFGQFDNGNLLVFYDVKAAGEDSKRTDVRKPAIRKLHVERMIRLALRCRSTDETTMNIRPSDFYVLMDGGRHGNSGTLLGSLKDDSDKAHSDASLDQKHWSTQAHHACSMMLVFMGAFAAGHSQADSELHDCLCRECGHPPAIDCPRLHDRRPDRAHACRHVTGCRGDVGSTEQALRWHHMRQCNHGCGTAARQRSGMENVNRAEEGTLRSRGSDYRHRSR